MIETEGVVIEREGEFAWVETQRQSACSSCGSSGACGSGLLAQVFGSRPTKVKVTNSIQAEVGEAVVIGLAERDMLLGSLRLYLLPLIGLFLGVILFDQGASYFRPDAGEFWSVLGGLLGLFAFPALIETFRSANSSLPMVLRKRHFIKVAMPEGH